MDVREKLIEICFREFCDLAGDTPCGCDGCPYGEYEPDNGGCYVEYKKDKIENLENDMDKYQKEDNGVTVQGLDGCEYCNGLPFSQMEDFTMPNASKKNYDIVTIRYCPMCGRRLPKPPKGE